LSLLEIKAPIAGTLVRVDARLGRSVEPNTVLAEVIDFDRLVVTARVPSREALLLKPGQPVGFGPGGPVTGTLVLVGRDIDPRTDTVMVRAAVPPDARLLPGQFLNIRIAAEERRDRLAVPIESLVIEDGRSEIAVVEGDRAARRPVTAGLRDGDQVEVDGEGLREGMTVVTVGAYGLPKESRIRIVGR
jgi:membrane fusion protein (multidrug efflux system)